MKLTKQKIETLWRTTIILDSIRDQRISALIKDRIGFFENQIKGETNAKLSDM